MTNTPPLQWLDAYLMTGKTPPPAVKTLHRIGPQLGYRYNADTDGIQVINSHLEIK